MDPKDTRSKIFNYEGDNPTHSFVTPNNIQQNDTATIDNRPYICTDSTNSGGLYTYAALEVGLFKSVQFLANIYLKMQFLY